MPTKNSPGIKKGPLAWGYGHCCGHYRCGRSYGSVVERDAKASKASRKPRGFCQRIAAELRAATSIWPTFVSAAATSPTASQLNRARIAKLPRILGEWCYPRK